MQYTITINQLAVINAGLDLDVIDMSIFDFIQHFAHSDKCMKLQSEIGTYFWISHTTIIQQLPILGISTGAGIVKRINKLIDAGLLTRHPNCDLMRKTFYKFGPNADKINFATENESLHPTTIVGGSHNDCLGTSHNDCLGNQHISNQDINNIPADGGLFGDMPVEVKERKQRRTSETLCLFVNSRFSDFDTFAAEFATPEFNGIDISYYFHAVADWSAQKGKKMKDWIATARNFIRSDIEKNKLHRIPGYGNVLSPDAMQYLKDMADGN